MSMEPETSPDRRMTRMAIGVGLATAAALTALALLTFDAADPSLNRAAGHEANNALGLLGAAWADLLLQLFGLAAIALPALLGWPAARLLRDRSAPSARRLGLAAAAAFAAAVALAGAGAPASWPIESGFGGLLGWSVLTHAAGLPRALFGGAGESLVALAFLIGAGVLAALSLGAPPRRIAATAKATLRVAQSGGRRVAPHAATAAEKLVLATGVWTLKRYEAVRAKLGVRAASKRRPVRIRRLEPRLDGLADRAPRPQRAAPEPETQDELEDFALPLDAAAPRRAPPPESVESIPDRPADAIDWRRFDHETPIQAFEDAREAPLPMAPPVRAPEPEPEPEPDWRAESAPPDPVLQPAPAPERAAPVAPRPAPPPARPAIERPPMQDILPDIDLLAPEEAAAAPALDEEALEARSRELESVLQDFGVKGEIIRARPGPVVTLFELEPAPGVKSSRVISLADDIARSMSAISCRIAVVPGRNALGIELPNPKRDMVRLRGLFEHGDFADGEAALPLALGQDIGGRAVCADLARMPHLLVAGTTGSGKSVAVNAMILSLLYRHSPDRCRFIMVDPKMLELSVYNDIPHLLTPVVTDPGKAVVALKWAVREMEERYAKMSALGVRNIASYNARIEEALNRGETPMRQVRTGFDPECGQPIIEEQPLPTEPLPFLVVVIDEMADLMLVAGKDVEAAIQRLAQMARAAGIHLIMATQRPSVDVVTGTIKANFPTRISFQVTSKIDSRTILGEQGAEQLLGQGDMLYMAGGGRISRVHGPFVSDGEVESVVAALKAMGAPSYIEGLTDDESEDGPTVDAAAAEDPVYEQAVELIRREQKASTSFIQRHLQIGYNRAARIIEAMEAQGLVGAANHVGRREVLLARAQDDAA